MKKHRVESFTKGWFIGDFAPTLLRTPHFEAAMKIYRKGDREGAHVHKIAAEFTIIGAGSFRMNGQTLGPGDIVELAPGDVADFECVEDGLTFVIKTPSAPFDKTMVER